MPVRMSAIAALTLVAAVALVPPGVAGGARDRCAAKRSTTEKSNAQVRVYSVKRRLGSETTTVYYACQKSSGQRVRVIDEFDDSTDASGLSVLDLKLAGTSVLARASGFEEIGPEGEDYEQLSVVDVRRGGRAYFIQIDTSDDDLYAGFRGTLLRADGSAAWITTGNEDYDEIDVLAPRADLPRPVAYAKGIDEKSLKFGGDGVTWTQNGQTRTARIR